MMPRPKPDFPIDRLTVYLPAPLYAQIREQSYSRDQSMNKIAVDLIRQALKKKNVRKNNTV
jgi:hypothetical protein